jgi:hypothetical protein
MNLAFVRFNFLILNRLTMKCFSVKENLRQLVWFRIERCFEFRMTFSEHTFSEKLNEIHYIITQP